MDHRYSRQIIFSEIGKDGQDMLARGRVVIIGLGALGSHSADILVRAGVGLVSLVDRDIVEIHNLQRQTLFDEKDVKEIALKAEAAGRKLKLINSQIEIVPQVMDVNSSNLEELVKECNVIVDGTDNFETRFLINDVSLKLNIPWIYGGAAGSQGMTMNVLPHETACLRCAINSLPDPGTTNTCDNTGIIPAIASTVASIQGIEAVKILLGSDSISRDLKIFDLWENRILNLDIPMDKSCSACSGDYEYLETEDKNEFLSICGSEAMQYRPGGDISLDLMILGTKLEKLGKVFLADKLLKFKSQEDEILIFKDGRMIIYGIKDPGRIRATYTKYIGL